MDETTKLADFKQEGTKIDSDESIFAALAGDTETDTLVDSLPESNQDDTDPSEEGDDGAPEGEPDNTPTAEDNVPFHKHPRWKEQQDKYKELKEANDDLIAKFQSIEDDKKEDVQAQLPEWWMTMYGNDDVSQTAYKQYSVQNSGLKDRIKEELRTERESAKQQASDSEARWDDWVESEIQSLKDEGHTFKKNDLMKVAIDMQPTDENGNISLRKSLEILNLKNSNKSDSKLERKKVAAITASDNKGSGLTKAPVNNPNTLRHQSFSSLVQN